MIKNFDDSSDPGTLDSFLLHYWVSEHAYTTEKKLFSGIKSYVDESTNGAKTLIAKLNSSAFLYSKLLDPDSHSWSREEDAIKLSLKALNTFKVKQQSAMTLSLIRAHSEKRITLKNLKKNLEKIEIFHYCFNAITSQRSSGTIASNYSKLAIRLSLATNDDQAQNVFNDLAEFLRNKMPTKNEFTVKFIELAYSSKKTKYKGIVKYTLSKLSPQNNNCLPISLDELTIEHVIPECHSKQGTCEETIANIGNLILVDRKTNAHELADKNPIEKIDLLLKKGYPMESFFIDDCDWSENHITNRANNIASHIYDLCAGKIL